MMESVHKSEKRRIRKKLLPSQTEAHNTSSEVYPSAKEKYKRRN